MIYRGYSIEKSKDFYKQLDIFLPSGKRLYTIHTMDEAKFAIDRHIEQLLKGL
jgi:hypothetical protein